MADQTTSSLELLFQRLHETSNPPEQLQQATIEAIDLIIYQQHMQRSVADFCLLLGTHENIMFYDDGADLYNAVMNNHVSDKKSSSKSRPFVKNWYIEVAANLFRDEAIQYRRLERNRVS